MPDPRHSLLLVSVAIAGLVAATPLAAQNAQDFQLPPQSTPTGPPAQGPVDDTVPLAPRPVNTPTPTPTAQATPTPAPTLLSKPGPTPTQRPAAASTPPPRTTASESSGAVPQGLPSATPSSNPFATQGAAAIPPAPNPQSTPRATPSASQASLRDTTSLPDYWPWLAGALAFLLATTLGLFAWRRRAMAPPLEIERPIVPQAPKGPLTASGGGAPVTLKAEALALSRSVMNATLAYRLSVTNRTSAMLTGLSIGGDLVAAHNRKPIDQQIADPALALAARHDISRIAPGQTVALEGSLQLPLAQVHPIRQGNALLFVPLMRWRADNHTIAPVARTYVVGMQPQVAGGRLQPFRLDEQPQTYSHIGQRAID